MELPSAPVAPPVVRALGAALGVVALVGIALVGVAPTPAAAADAPVVTSSALTAQSEDTVTLTLTGCTGGQPHIEIIGNLWSTAPRPFPSLLTPVEGPAGVWRADTKISQVSDIGFEGICASGARSARVVVDLEWREAFPDPYLEENVPMKGVAGTDCDGGDTPVVWFRAGERIIERHPVVDAGGDWFEPTPPIPNPYAMLVSPLCGTGSPNYLSFPFRSGPGPAYPPVHTGWHMSPGDGPPGTTYTATFACEGSPARLWRSQVGTEGEVEVPLSGNIRKSFTAVAGATDDRYRTECGPRTDVIRFDVDAPSMAVVPASDRAAGAQVLAGTDCPDQTAAHVRFAVAGGGARTATGVIDAFGDWSVPVPDDVPVASAEASCGAVAYEPVALDGVAAPLAPGAGAAEGVPAAPTAAVAADPVAGTASYAG